MIISAKRGCSPIPPTPRILELREQHRRAITRPLTNEPAVPLAHEPTGTLDPTTATETVDLPLELRRERGTTLLLATHDLTLASRCDTVVRLLDGQVTDVQDLTGGFTREETLAGINRLD